MFQKNSDTENIYAYERDVTIFCRKVFRLTVPKNFVGEPFIVLERFGYRKNLCIKRRYHWSPLKHLCLIVSKNFAGEPFFVSKKLWHPRFSCEGGEHIVLSKSFFCFTGPKNCISVKSVFQKFSGVDDKLLIKDGGCPVFASICLTHSTGKFFGILFNISRNFGYWNFSCVRIGYHYLPLNFFKVPECRKVSWGNYSVFQT